MVGESWDVFTKQVLVEKHTGGIQGHDPSLTPSADAHVYLLYTIF